MAATSGRGLGVAAAVTLAGLVACLAAGSQGFGTVAGIGKMTASCGFLAMAYCAGALESRFGMAILGALFFSWWGDLFLIFSGTFLAGLIAFFLGHLGYCVAFVIHGVRWAWAGLALLLLAVPFAIIFPWLNPHLPDDLRIPVYCYIGVITFMVALSIGAWRNNGSWLLPAAAVLFYVSDLFVARERFVFSTPFNPLIGLPLYFGGQMVFAYSIRATHRLRGIGQG